VLFGARVLPYRALLVDAVKWGPELRRPPKLPQ